MIKSGDIGNNLASVIQYTKLYSGEYLKCDILQISHRGYNLLTSFYNNCAPEYAVVPNAIETLKKHAAKYEFYANLVDNGKLHFAGNYTTALSISGSTITIEKISRYDNPTGKLN